MRQSFQASGICVKLFLLKSVNLQSLVCLLFSQPEKTSGTIKEQLEAIAPALDKLWKQKDEKIKEFSDVQSQIQKISAEIAGTSAQVENITVDESNLSMKKLDEFNAQLQDLQKEKVTTFLHAEFVKCFWSISLNSELFLAFLSCFSRVTGCTRFLNLSAQFTIFVLSLAWTSLLLSQKCIQA